MRGKRGKEEEGNNGYVKERTKTGGDGRGKGGDGRGKGGDGRENERRRKVGK